MKVNGWISFGCIMVAIAIGTAIAVMISDVATVNADWCDGRPECLMDWVSATSGWAAAITAIIVAGLTIPHLKRQTHEVRRQADFVVGDALPSLDVVEHLREKGEYVVIVQNWNRRGVIVRDIAVPWPTGTLNFLSIEVDGRIVDANGKSFQFPIALRGLTVRDQPPQTLEVRIVITRDDDTIVYEWGKDARVYAPCHILGEFHRSEILQAESVSASRA